MNVESTKGAFASEEREEVQHCWWVAWEHVWKGKPNPSPLLKIKTTKTTSYYCLQCRLNLLAQSLVTKF